MKINLEGIPLIHDISRADHLSYSLFTQRHEKNFETIKITRETSGVNFHQIQKNTEKHLKGTT